MRRPRASADNVIMQEAIDGGLLPTKKPHASAQKSSVKRRQSTPGVRKPELSQKPCASGTSVIKKSQAVVPKLPNLPRQSTRNSDTVIISKISGAGTTKHVTFDKLPSKDPLSSPNSSAVRQGLNGNANIPPTLGNNICDSVPTARPYECSKCPSLHLGRFDDLANHVLTHFTTPPLPYHCWKCGHANPNDRAAFDAHLRQCNAGTLESYLKERAQNSAHSFKSAFKACFPRFVASLAEADFLELALAKLSPGAVQPAAVGKPGPTGALGFGGPGTSGPSTSKLG